MYVKDTINCYFINKANETDVYVQPIWVETMKSKDEIILRV